MFLYPNGYFDKVRDIKIEYLKKNEIKAIILDVDNTLIDYYKVFPERNKRMGKNSKRKWNKILYCLK